MFYATNTLYERRKACYNCLKKANRGPAANARGLGSGRLKKRKERKDMYNEFDAFGELFSQYNTYANKTSANGQKPVSLLKFALGQF